MAPPDDIQVGDLVNVPGGMYGTVKFLGSVAGKQGRFAGVELATEYAGRGKNSGDVEGRSYFTTSVPGSGIFVPINSSKYVTKRASGTPPTPASKPVGTTTNFSKSVGPGVGAATSVSRPKFRRPSLPRPESPRAHPPPKLNLAGLRTPSSFSKSSPVNGGVPRTPRTTRPSSRPASRLSVEDNTPTSVRRSDAVRTPAFDDSDAQERIRFLENQLRDRDKQLEEQASTLAEFQKSITELEGSDALQVRAQLREKNEKIAALTAEFDSHRADFRSTLDTLEIAASETERVYEKRIEELLQANRDLQERGDDVETVARQLKQLEELVSELEEGLEDARRGEAEAAGEVEFLRGEVERTRLELKQEKEKSAAALKGGETTSKDLDQKDDEIRGLKAIIHSLSRGEPTQQPNGAANRKSDSLEAERNAKMEQMERHIEELKRENERSKRQIEDMERDLGYHPGTYSRQADGRKRSGTVTKHTSPQSGGNTISPGSANHTHSLSDRTVVPNDWHESPPPAGNGQQYMPFSPGRRSIPTESHRRLESMQEYDAHSSSTDDGSALWCEICETSGHDILTCTNMFGSGAGNNPSNPAPKTKQNNDTTTPLSNTHDTGSFATPNANNQRNSAGAHNGNGMNNNNTGSPTSQRTGREAVLEGLKTIGGLSNNMAPAAGRTTGVIDETKWCALCERDGHDSIDCPLDD